MKYLISADTSRNMHHQRGAALIVTMIFLLIITVIAINSLTNTSMQTSMLANAQRNQLTFQEAESAIDRTISQTDSAYKLSNGLQASGCNTSDSFNQTTYTANNTSTTSASELLYKGRRADLNSSGSIRISGGQSSGAGSAGVVYVVEAIGTSTFDRDDAAVSTVIHQGLEFAGPDKFCDSDF